MSYFVFEEILLCIFYIIYYKIYRGLLSYYLKNEKSSFNYFN